MTVVKYEPEDGDEVTCTWFNDNGLPIEKSFHQDLLELDEPIDLSEIATVR